MANRFVKGEVGGAAGVACRRPGPKLAMTSHRRRCSPDAGIRRDRTRKAAGRCAGAPGTSDDSGSGGGGGGSGGGSGGSGSGEGDRDRDPPRRGSCSPAVVIWLHSPSVSSCSRSKPARPPPGGGSEGGLGRKGREGKGRGGGREHPPARQEAGPGGLPCHVSRTRGSWT